MKKILILFMVVLAITACSSTDEPAKKLEVELTSFSGKFLTEEEAVKIARSAIVDFGLKESARANSEACVSLFRKPSSRVAETDTTYYVVNFRDGGFAVVSAYRNSDVSILAISGKGEFSEKTNPTSMEYLASLADAGVGIGGFQPLPTTPDSSVMFMENSHLEVSCLKPEIVEHYVPTTWGQGDPYNKFCPIREGKHCPVGCVAVAIGQILAKHQSPKEIKGYNLNWNKMIESPSIHDLDSIGVDNIARLLREAGGLCYMLYTANGSLANDFFAIEAFKKLGYSSAQRCDSIEESIKNLKACGPVYIRGKDVRYDGHAWVMDATMDCKTVWHEVSNTDKSRRVLRAISTQKYAHMNWGWDGECDGFYLYKDEYEKDKIIVDKFVLDTKVWCIIDIH